MKRKITTGIYPEDRSAKSTEISWQVLQSSCCILYKGTKARAVYSGNNLNKNCTFNHCTFPALWHSWKLDFLQSTSRPFRLIRSSFSTVAEKTPSVSIELMITVKPTNYLSFCTLSRKCFSQESARRVSKESGPEMEEEIWGLLFWALDCCCIENG